MAIKMHLNSIKREEDTYLYIYHAQEKAKLGSTFAYFTIAGIIGSFKVSKGMDWLIGKWGNQKKAAQIRFRRKYPHYNLGDIFWMLSFTNQDLKLDEIVRNAENIWGAELNIEIGILSAMEIQTVNFSNKILQEAAKQQSELRKEWSLLTGQDYPELGMPKR